MTLISTLKRKSRHYQWALFTKRDKSKELDILLENAPIGIVLSDKSNQFIFVNTYFQNMLGYTEEELLALNIDAITHTDSLEDSFQAIEGAYSGDDRVFLRKRYLHKNGDVIDARTHIGVVHDKNGTALYQCTAVIKTEHCNQCEKDIVSIASFDA